MVANTTLSTAAADLLMQFHGGFPGIFLESPFRTTQKKNIPIKRSMEFEKLVDRDSIKEAVDNMLFVGHNLFLLPLLLLLAS